MINSRRFRGAFFFALLFSLPTIINLTRGSIHNSDDSIYAEVMREVSQGQVRPLRFSGEIFQAKPPAIFWLGGLLARTFGDYDWVYRLPSVLSLFIIFFFAFRSAGLLAGLLLLGSTLLMSFGRRVMLDLPLIAVTFFLVWLTLRPNKPIPWIAFWLGAAVGWWIKEILILPALAGLLVGLALERLDEFQKKDFWIGLTVFGGAILSLYLFRSSGGQITLSPTTSVTSPALVFTPGSAIYWDLLGSDSPFLWLLPLLLFFRRKSIPWPALGMVLFQFISIWFPSNRLPHYGLPFIASAFLMIALLIPGELRKPIRISIFLLVAAQAIWANRFQWKPDSFELDPAARTRSLGTEIANLIPQSSSFCVVDTYLPGFRYYANRSAVGLYTHNRTFRAMAQVEELRNLVHEVPEEELASEVFKRCEGLAVGPVIRFQSEEWKILREDESLALAKTVSRIPSTP